MQRTGRKRIVYEAARREMELITHLVPKHSSTQGASARLTQARCEVSSITHLSQAKKYASKGLTPYRLQGELTAEKKPLCASPRVARELKIKSFQANGDKRQLLMHE